MEIVYDDGRINTTIGAILDALVENGFEHIRGTWFKYGEDAENGEKLIIGACVLGQAALNLSANDDSIQRVLNKYIKIPYGRIPKHVRNAYEPDEAGGIGSILISMNDAYEYANGGVNRYYYSWKQLVNYATKHIEPYRNTEVILYRKGYDVMRKSK